MAATGIVLATVVLLRAAFPDAAVRREWSAVVLLSLGYGHQLGALAAGFRRGAGRRALLTLAAIGSGFATLLALLPPAPLVALLTAIAVWHVFENERAMARIGGRAASSRLPALALAGAAQTALLALAATFAVLAAPSEIARIALGIGLPPAFAVWTWEDLIGLLLFHHVVSWALFAARAGRRRSVAASHIVPLVAAAASVLVWPATVGWLASPLPYLMTSVAHAIHTALERGVERA